MWSSEIGIFSLDQDIPKKTLVHTNGACKVANETQEMTGFIEVDRFYFLFETGSN